MNDTVRNNIIFTSTYEPAWYREVVDKCCLLPDFNILEYNDETEIGEKGINLSGGQKQRVGLARAVFQKAQLYLLDDPLSAVDPHVLTDLFKDVIGPRGLLKNTTRILVTQSQAVLPLCDRIVLLKEGKIDFVGTYDELIEKDVSIKAILGDPDESNERAVAGEAGEYQEAISKMRASQDNAEEMAVGSVSWRVYLLVLKKFGLLYASLSLGGYILYEIGMIWGMFWLRTWSDDAKHRNSDLMAALNDTIHISPDETNSSLIEKAAEETVRVALDYSTESASPMDRVNMFVLIGTIELCGIVVGCLCLAIGILKTSTSLHHSVLDAVMRAPLQFFDKTPSGRIINRLSKDLCALDLEFFFFLDGWIVCFGSIVGAVAVITYEVPLLLSVITPCAVLLMVLLVSFLMLPAKFERSSHRMLENCLRKKSASKT